MTGVLLALGESLLFGAKENVLAMRQAVVRNHVGLGPASNQKIRSGKK